MEAALGAALGDDLEASIDGSAPAFWGKLDGVADELPLPEGANPLSAMVTAPVELSRRLAQIGVVDRARGARLQPLLKPGQRLVSVEGDLWRWDGFCATADAPTAAAQRLAQKNRLAELDKAAIEAHKQVAASEAAYEQAKTALATDLENERNCRDAARSQQTQLGEARNELVRAERAVSELSNRRSALEEACVRLKSSHEETNSVHAEASASLLTTPDISLLEQKLATLRLEVASERAAFAEARPYSMVCRVKNYCVDSVWKPLAGNANLGLIVPQMLKNKLQF